MTVPSDDDVLANPWVDAPPDARPSRAAGASSPGVARRATAGVDDLAVPVESAPESLTTATAPPTALPTVTAATTTPATTDTTATTAMGGDALSTKGAGADMVLTTDDAGDGTAVDNATTGAGRAEAAAVECTAAARSWSTDPDAGTADAAPETNEGASSLPVDGEGTDSASVSPGRDEGSGGDTRALISTSSPPPGNESEGEEACKGQAAKAVGAEAVNAGAPTPSVSATSPIAASPSTPSTAAPPSATSSPTSPTAAAPAPPDKPELSSTSTSSGPSAVTPRRVPPQDNTPGDMSGSTIVDNVNTSKALPDVSASSASGSASPSSPAAESSTPAAARPPPPTLATSPTALGASTNKPLPPRSASITSATLAPYPPRHSSLSPSLQPTLLTPAPGAPRTPSPPGAPVKPPPATTRVTADLEEFDPFATPVPVAVPPPVPVKDSRQPSRPRGGAQSQPQSQQSTPRSSARRSGSGGSRRSAASGHEATPSAATTEPGPVRPPIGGHRVSTSIDEPQFNFAGFLRDLRTKPAEPVARYLKSFLTNFARKPFTVNEQIKLIRDFLAFIADKMRIVEPWRSQNEAEFDNALEAMEKLVMNRLYPYTFTPQLAGGTQTITTDDLERDAVFAQRVRLFGWVQEKHLDIPEGEQSVGFLAFAEQELLKINHYKAPRDKMICILNCCKVIFGLIRHTQGNEAGADAFVPILIFVVLRANPDNMLSNVEYINRFRNPEKLSGEGGYYLASLQGAIAFIETMDASSLSSITQDEFEANVEQAIRDLPTSPTSPRVESSPSVAGSGTSDMSPFATSPGEEPARPLTMPATAAALDGTKRFFQRTGDAAKEAVSRPLSAIGKILETMHAAESESGEDSEDERDRDRWHKQQQQQQHGTPHAHAPPPPQARYTAPQRTHAHPHAPHQPQPPSRLLAQLGLSPGTSEAPTPRDRTPTPDASAYHAAMAAQQAANFQRQQQFRHDVEAGYPGAYAAAPAAAAQAQWQQQMYPQNQHQNQSSAPPGHAQGMGQTAAQQQAFYAQQQAQLAQHAAAHHAQQMQSTLEASGEAYAREQAREQARSANVHTLLQMFPALGEEVVDAVLYSCGDDLGLAIDRLLEM